MPDVMRESHIFALPSYREGLPTAVVEAAACGRPVVATDVPGCREVVIDGENGFLVPAKNPQALAEALIRNSSKNFQALRRSAWVSAVEKWCWNRSPRARIFSQVLYSFTHR